MPHVQVAVRCRPPLAAEADKPCNKIEANEVNNTIRVQASATQDKVFAFDHVIPETATQEAVFDIVDPMIDHALDGLHATIFAYGQTGSGKTYTMEGLEYFSDAERHVRANVRTDKSRHGVIPRSIEALFERAHMRMRNNSSVRYKIKCSFYQLYNERVTDLLNPSSVVNKDGLRIRWSRDDHFSVENLFIFECDDAAQVRDLFFMGVKHKVMGSNCMNQQSSRSHCVFTLYVHSWDPDTPDCVVRSELSLVDLAGSEKLLLLAQDPSPQLLKESIEINTSLLALGKVITALAQSAKTHVPYRDSKLTRLLKHALGGNSMTLMFACIAPIDSYMEETTSTLMYAGRARNITNDPRVNEDPRAALIRQLRNEIMSLKQELAYYRQLALEGAAVDPLRAAPSFSVGGGQRPASTEPRLHGAASSSRAVHMTGGPSDLGADEEKTLLSEKLISSCTMVKELIALNGQLRAAFDKVNGIRATAETREEQLNAENLALRERIEMLESITWQAAGEGGPARSSSTSQTPSTPPRAAAAAAPKARAPPQPVHYQSSSDDPYGGGLSFKERLGQYNTKYRNPTKPASYEAYYGVARKNATAALSEHLAKDIDALLGKLPASTASMVPASVHNSAAFGSLSFGGAGPSVDGLEERRRQRQLRMSQIEEQRRAMEGGLPFDAYASVPPAPTASSVASSLQPSSSSMVRGSSSGRLFDYLSRAETQSVFTQEQLELLNRQRAPVGGGLARVSSHGAPTPPPLRMSSRRY